MTEDSFKKDILKEHFKEHFKYKWNVWGLGFHPLGKSQCFGQSFGLWGCVMEIGYSSGEVTVSVTLADNFLWLFQSQVKIFTMRKIEHGVTM